MKRNSVLIILLLACTVSISCGKSFTIERGFEPPKTLIIERTPQGGALVRAMFGDIYMREMNINDFTKLFKTEMFSRTVKNNRVPQRMPSYFFFETIIANDSDSQVALKSIVLRYKNTDHAALSLEQVKKQCTSPAYAQMNFDMLLAQFRLLGDARTISLIDLKHDLVLYKLPFISAGEKTFCVYAFEWVPVEIETVKVIMTFTVSDGEKTIDFDLVRPTYRTGGKNFVKPAPPKEFEL